MWSKRGIHCVRKSHLAWKVLVIFWQTDCFFTTTFEKLIPYPTSLLHDISLNKINKQVMPLSQLILWKMFMVSENWGAIGRKTCGQILNFSLSYMWQVFPGHHTCYFSACVSNKFPTEVGNVGPYLMTKSFLNSKVGGCEFLSGSSLLACLHAAPPGTPLTSL